MSRRSIKEYILRKRDDYLGETQSGKHKMLDEICKTVGLTRKYVIKLLSGNIEYRERRGRGKTYTAEVVDVLKAVWIEAGCPCLPYFKVQIGMWLDEYSSHVAVVNGHVRELLLKMSDRTMSRALSGEVRVKLGWSKVNKRSGRNNGNEIKDLVPCASGEKVMACKVPPGDVQADTFALGGGDSADNFFWILNCTDRKTQWEGAVSDMESCATHHACGASAQHGAVPILLHVTAFRQWRRDTEPSCDGVPRDDETRSVCVAFAPEEVQRQCACGRKKRGVGQAVVRRD